MSEIFEDTFEEFCYQNNIVITHHGSLTTKIRGFCYYDGIYYNVVLNNSHSTPQLKKTTIHEIIHIMENHFNCSSEHISECEKEVDYIIKEMRFAWGGY